VAESGFIETTRVKREAFGLKHLKGEPTRKKR